VHRVKFVVAWDNNRVELFHGARQLVPNKVIERLDLVPDQLCFIVFFIIGLDDGKGQSLDIFLGQVGKEFVRGRHCKYGKSSWIIS
jgi:hypothetical protein